MGRGLGGQGSPPTFKVLVGAHPVPSIECSLSKLQDRTGRHLVKPWMPSNSSLDLLALSHPAPGLPVAPYIIPSREQQIKTITAGWQQYPMPLLGEFVFTGKQVL